MAQEFNRKALTLVVAQICQTIGWHSINSTPLELMVDLLHRYLFEVGKNAHQYAEQLGHTVPDIDDLGLAFHELGVNLDELREYVQYVDSVPFAHQVPKFPVPRESHLNFLKPGSREVVTRPVHVHEHLPPMHPEMENEITEEYTNKNSPLTVDTASPGPSSGPNSAGGSTSPLASPKLNNHNPFKRPGEPPSAEGSTFKRARVLMEEEGRPLREISSVMMTTSGFLSPAREGKLPESRTPLQPSDSRSNSPQPAHYPSVPPEVNKPEKKLKKILPKKVSDNIKRIDKENKKKESKDSIVEDLHADDSNVAKLVSMKELSKLKALKSGAIKLTQQPGSSNSGGSYKIPKVSANKPSVKKSNNLKSQKSQKPNHPQQWVGPVKSPPSPDRDEFFDGREHPEIVTKIPSAPDKQKLNIFKKISKVKEEKTDRSEKFDRSSGSPGREIKSAPGGWVIDEELRKEQLRSSQIDVCIESVIQRGIEESLYKHKDVSISSDSFVDVDGNYSTRSPSYSNDNDGSRPDTPTAPKTPEIAHTLLAKEEYRRKKLEKSKAKKELKAKMKEMSPKKFKTELSDDEIMPDRPKTPEVKLDMKPFPYGNFPPHPGLIPPILESQSHFMQSPPRDCPDLPEKPVTPGAGIGIGSTSSHPLPQTPTSLMSSFFNTSPASASTPSIPPTPGGHIVPLTPGSSITAVSPQSQKKCLDGKGVALLKKKEHKKDKKDKKDKIRIKKKKDKKDKNKDKEKSLKKKDRVLKKIKDKIDKDLKNFDKSKDKIKEKKKDKKKKDDGGSVSPHHQQLLVTEELGVPKLTLRLGSDSPRPPTPEIPPTAPKIVIKPVKKPVSEEERMLKAGIPPPPPLFSSSHVIESESYRREKEREREREREERERIEREKELERERERERQVELEREREREKEREWERERERARLEELDTRISPSAGRPSKPKSKVKQGQLKLAAAKVAAKAPPTLLPEDPQPKSQAARQSKRNESDQDLIVDAMGNKIWICPSCKGPDDGRPMIGCDDCDAWYHWVCVNIQVPPDENENWYCRYCIVKKSESAERKKKKKSRKKPKVPGS